MAVARRNDGTTGYDNLEKQHIHMAAEMDAADVDNNYEDELLTPGASHEIAGGLDRGEVAELVAARFQLDIHMESSGQDYSQSSWHYELSSDDTGKMVGNNTKVSSEYSPDYESGVAISRSTDPDVLYQWKGSANGQLVDPSQTLAAGGSSQQTDGEFIDFRGTFGEGPTFDRHNELYSHFEWDLIANNQDIGTEIDVQITLYWAIREDC